MDIQVLKTYSHQGLCRAIDIFRHPEEFPKRTQLLGFRFLLQYRHMDTVLSPTKDGIIAEMRKMIDDHYTVGTQDSHSVLMELVDMLIDYSPQDGEKLLAYLREQRATANDNGPGASDAGPECTVYGDTQSAHNQAISESTRKAAKYLADKFAPNFGPGAAGIQEKIKHYEKVKVGLIRRFGEDIEPVIERIYIDNAHFGIGYTVDEVLMSLLNWIDFKMKEYKNKPYFCSMCSARFNKSDAGQQHLSIHKPKIPQLLMNDKFPTNEIFQRLGEELLEMHNYCASGLLSRIVNTVQGFNDDDHALEILISSREQVKTVVYNHLNRAIQECGDEEVLEGLTEGGAKFLSFVKQEIASRIEEWHQEYGDDFLEHVMTVVNEYTSTMTYE